jgi:hypothetical protein
MSNLSWSTNLEQLRPRAYQLEMLEASLKENIIVAVSVPTDSKTLRSDTTADGHWKRENPNVGSTLILSHDGLTSCARAEQYYEYPQSLKSARLRK